MSYVESYSPSLLRPIARAPARARLGVTRQLPFHGEDLWTGYEFSWLAKSGQPRVAGLLLRVPCTSPNLVESKSMKFYLNSFAMARFVDRAEVARTLESDLAGVCGAEIGVELIELDQLGGLAAMSGERFDQPLSHFHAENSGVGFAAMPGKSLDRLGVAIDHFERNPDLLHVANAGDPVANDGDPFPSGTESEKSGDAQRLAEGRRSAADTGHVTETWHTHLFRSVCPITGQPDWASVLVDYTGPRIVPEGLLRYLVSYRQHAAFHEDTVEQLFVDLLERCRPTELRVYGRFQRRGGLDINPYRSTGGEAAPTWRLARQ